MTFAILSFMIMLNPFALFLYLEPIMDDLDHKEFLRVLIKASLISFSIFLIFILSGDLIFRKVFNINFESFRIFGGIIIFAYAYHFIIKGNKAFITMKANLNDLASEIALPFMVGAGTISLSILMSHNLKKVMAMAALSLCLFLNYIIIYLFKIFRDTIAKRKFRILFDKVMEIMLRINGFFVGAIGIDMIMHGLKKIFLL